MKHPKFRVADVLHLAPEVLDELAKVAFDAAALLPTMPADIEIVGSYAFGNARIGSDLDLNLAMSDWNSQVPFCRDYRFDPTFSAAFKQRILEYADKWGLTIEVGPVDCDSRSYNAVYSLTERKLFNREPGQVIDQHLKWNGYLWRWEPTLPTKRAAYWLEDEWADEVPTWRKTYGEHFQEPLTILQG